MILEDIIRIFSRSKCVRPENDSKKCLLIWPVQKSVTPTVQMELRGDRELQKFAIYVAARTPKWVQGLNVLIPSQLERLLTL